MTLTPTDMADIAAVGTALAPPLVELVKSVTWPTAAKQALALAFSAVIAVIGFVVAGVNFTATGLASEIGLVFVGSQVAYQTYFRNSTAAGKLNSLLRRPKATAK